MATEHDEYGNEWEAPFDLTPALLAAVRREAEHRVNHYNDHPRIVAMYAHLADACHHLCADLAVGAAQKQAEDARAELAALAGNGKPKTARPVKRARKNPG